MINTEIEILLIEDNLNDAELTIRALKKNKVGNVIVHMKDGRDALDFLFAEGPFEGRNVNHKPKEMPKVSGLEVLERIKKNENTRQIPVVVLTSSKENKDIDLAYKLGANSYIVKPVEFESFSNAISHLGIYWALINQSPD